MLKIWASNISELVKTVVLDDEEYLVCPVVMAVEGVMNGLFYSAQELGDHPEKWNGRPVVIDHPEFNGYPTSANTPTLFQTQTVGVIYNTYFNEVNRSLCAEAWLNKRKTEKISPEILEKLENNENIEVSTGLMLTAVECEGVHNGEGYKATAHDYHPDHLALLPNGVGACSWADGGGMPRINKAKRPKNIGARIVEMAMNAKRMSNEMSLDDKRRAVVSAFEWYSDSESVYVDAVFDNYVIYSHRKDSDWKIYRQSFEMSGEKAVPSGDPVEVQRKVEYVPVGNTQKPDGRVANKQKEKKMDREKVISALIGNEKTGFTDNHREFLESLTDEQLTSISENAPEVEVPAPVETNEEQETADTSVEDVLNSVPPQYRGMFEDMHKSYEANRKTAIATIITNAKGLSEKSLGTLSLSDLQSLAASYVKETATNYGGRATARTTANETVEVPVLPVPSYKESK